LEMSTNNDDGNINETNASSEVPSPEIMIIPTLTTFSQHLGGAADDIFKMNILLYLNSKDLCILSATSRYFQSVCQSPTLWTSLYRKDFIQDDIYDGNQNLNGSPNIFNFHLTSLIPSHSSTPSLRNTNRYQPVITAPSEPERIPKSVYLHRMCEVNERINNFEKDRQRIDLEAAHASRVETVENLLDIIHVRILPVFCCLSIFLSVLLVCQQIDGQMKIPLWSCFAPFVIFIFYLSFCICNVRQVHGHQYNSHSILKGLWLNFDSILKPIIHDVNNQTQQPYFVIYFILLLLLLSTLQIAMIVLKISTYQPINILERVNWAIILLPLWLFLALFCSVPCFQRYAGFHMRSQGYLMCMFIFWIPVTIFFVCLSVKLQTNDHRLQIALILMPFWIIEGIALLCSLIFLIFGIIRLRRGFLDRIDEHIAITAIVWGVLTPLIIIQALLSVRDDNYSKAPSHAAKHPTATETFSPLLVVFALLTVFAGIYSFTTKTPFQEAREQTFEYASGLRVIINF